MGQQSSAPKGYSNGKPYVSTKDLENLPDILTLTKEFPVEKVPRDSQGFVQAFSIDQEAEYLAFFEKYGFVVIDNILTNDENEKTINEIWDYVESKNFGWDGTPKVDRNDPATWSDESWPRTGAGILGNKPAKGPQAWQNRQNPNLYKVFSTLMKQKELWVSVDRYGIMRPTKDVPVAKGSAEKADHPDWKSPDALWIHWDLNPWTWCGTKDGKDYEFDDFISENNGSRNTGQLKLQGLINLIDSREQDGGFCTIPGFCHHLPEWAALTKGSKYAVLKGSSDFVFAPQNDPMLKYAEKITSRAGSLIVWRGEQPHCNYGVDSERFRMNQYVKMFPAQEGGPNTQDRTQMLQCMLPKDFTPTPLGRKLFGLESWKS